MNEKSEMQPMVQNAAVRSGQQEECASDEISLVDLMLILWKGKWIIAACTVLVTIAGTVYALLAPEVFSTSTIFITKTAKQSGGGSLGQLASLAGISMGNNGSVDPSEYLDKVIEDRNFIETLFEQKWHFQGDSLPLEQILAIEADTTLPNWEYRYYMTKINAVRNRKLLSLKNNVKSGLLTLSTNAPDPQLAYDLNNFTLDFIRLYIRNSLKSQAKEKRVFIEGRIKESKDALEKAEDALAKHRASNLMTRSPQALLEEARLTRGVAMNQEIYIQFQKQYELARIEELNDQTLVQVVKGAEVPVSRSKPNKRLLVIVSAIAGIVAGVSIVFVYRMVNKVITTAEISRFLGAHV